MSQGQPYHAYMCLWRALPHAVVDALPDVGCDPPELAGSVQHFRGILRKYRNAAFHVQFEYWRCDKMGPPIEDEDSAERIHMNHDGCRCFLERKIAEM